MTTFSRETELSFHRKDAEQEAGLLMSQRDSGYARKSDRIIDRYWIGMIESYKARYPKITDLIRRGYSAERIAELAGCEVWVAKMLKYSGRF